LLQKKLGINEAQANGCRWVLRDCKKWEEFADRIKSEGAQMAEFAMTSTG